VLLDGELNSLEGAVCRALEEPSLRMIDRLGRSTGDVTL
jgi:hypothetical protein